MKTIQKCLALSLLAALLLSLCACGEMPILPTKTESFLMGVSEAPDSLNPVYAESEMAWEYFLLCYDTLWRLDGNGEPQPCLVESWDKSSDGLVWTIRLRQDVYFNDPTQEEPVQLNARDVQFSYELFMRFSEHCKNYFNAIAAIECPDSFTLVIRTDTVKNDLLYNPVPILPRYLWSAYSDSPRSMDNSAMIGSGPFVYQPPNLPEGEQQTSWRFVANESYFAGASTLDELEFTLTANPATAALQLVDGDLDGCMGLTDIQLITLAEEQSIDLTTGQGPGRGSYVLAMNMTSGALKDEQVRQALLYCLDKERVFSIALGGLGAEGCGFADPNSPYALDPSFDSQLFDTVTAQNMLAAAGYQDYDGDGILETKDNKLELNFSLYTREGEDWSASAQKLFASELEELGVRIRWKTTDSTDITDLCKKEGEWDIYIAHRPSGMDPQYVAATFAGGASETGWQSEDYDRLYAAFAAASDPAERQSLCHQLQQLVLAQCPYVVLGYGSDVQGVCGDVWTGYEELLASGRGLFGTGSADAYMKLRSYTEKELEEQQGASADPVAAILEE